MAYTAHDLEQLQLFLLSVCGTT